VPLVDVHRRVAASPAATVAGLVFRLTVGGRGLLTFTLKVDVAVPPGPVAVAVYTVVLAGDTETEPFADSVPILLSMVTVSVFEEFQLSVVLLPEVMLAGTAMRLIVGGNTTLTLALAIVVPPGPLAVAM
jgi:hypothetical protein